jgi:ATP-dependent helicase HrpA
LAVPEAEREVGRRLRGVAGLAGVPSHLPKPAALAADCLAAAADRIIAAEGGPAWDADAFAALEAAARARLARLAAGAATRAAGLVVAAGQLEERLTSAAVAPALRPAADDMRSQIARLVSPGFVSRGGLARLQDLGRYLEAVRVRLDKLAERPGRDSELTAQVHALEAEVGRAVAALPPERRPGARAELGWMLEELRVSYFAQALGTPAPVSEPRIRRRLAELTTT